MGLPLYLGLVIQRFFPWLSWLSASHKSLSALLGRSGADCLDLPWLRARHQTCSFCAVCSRFDNAEGKAGGSPVAKGAESYRAGLRSWTGGVTFAFQKDLVECLAPEGHRQKVWLGAVSILSIFHSRHLPKRKCYLWQPRLCFLQGGV